uniref:Secreted protein n=1 Tax=Parastrongyloides trichosuri TaxID=131310 RepID=A0A0N4Z5J0_PARTI
MPQNPGRNLGNGDSEGGAAVFLGCVDAVIGGCVFVPVLCDPDAFAQLGPVQYLHGGAPDGHLGVRGMDWRADCGVLPGPGIWCSYGSPPDHGRGPYSGVRCQCGHRHHLCAGSDSGRFHVRLVAAAVFGGCGHGGAVHGH